MRDLLRAYRALIGAAWSTALAYRVQLVIYMLSFVFPLVMLAVWLTVEDQTGPIGGFDRTAFISYYIAAAAAYRLTNVSAVYRWDREIRTGDLSIRLLKPLDPFHHFLSQSLGLKLFDSMLLVPLIGTIALVAPSVTYPLSWGRACATLASIILAILLNTLIGTAFGMLSFWTTQSRNFALIWSGIGQLLSGFVVPLALYPPGVRAFAQVLPFQSMVSLPAEILMGRIGWREVGLRFLVGIAWMLVAMVIYRLLWRRGLRRYEAVGA